MEKTYDPKAIEKKWADYWEKRQLSKPTAQGSPYCIMLPPPNVTGTLHMGHGFQQTLMDTLIRYHRMKGERTLWQGGTDHAGIATQMVVEQQLAQEDLTREDLGRQAFIKRVWEWRERSGGKITHQMRRLGVSIDWSRERFSMDEGLSRATTEAFIRLHHEGLIYRGKRLVNWDPKLNTAISDLEVVTEEVEGHLWHIRYPLAEGSGHLIIATTRPETLLGDVAIAVHPQDERYQPFVGKKVRLPLTDRTIPVIADEAVDKEFGTGSLKITPGHDFNDYEIGQRHQLPLINILTSEGYLNENVPEPYRGLERFEARKKIIADLQRENLLEKTEPYRVPVPRGERSGVIIEPLLTDQWFIKMEALAKPAMEAVESGELKFIPKNWEKTYLQWLSNIQDWCISRQLWWGHRLPVWYDEEKNSYVGRSREEILKKYHLSPDVKLQQETDVLDTWFSASLWPFATLGWPEKTESFKTFYPTQVLVTGFDIIFFWVARMVMMGLKLTHKIPFHSVYIHGLIRDSQGRKMSKSKGNVIDPIDIIDGISLDALIEKRTHALLQPKMAKTIEKMTRKEFPNGIASFGTDALRFTFCALASRGRDINFDMGRIDGYRNFCNKIWNAARFVTMNTQEKDLNPEKPLSYSAADEWIRTRLQQTIKNAEEALSQYRFDLLAQTLYEFTWNEYCDWYVEFAKCILYDKQAKPAQLRGTRVALLEVLEILLRLLHPVMPFITEEIWQTVAPLAGKEGKSIMVEHWPQFNIHEMNYDAKVEIEWVKNVITAIRTLRAEIGISPAKRIPVIFGKGDEKDKKRIAKMKSYIKTLGKVSQLRFAKHDDCFSATATGIVERLEIHIPLAGVIDKQTEIARLKKEISKLQKEEEKSLKKLDNPNYLQRAPQEVVEKERLSLEKTQNALKKLQSQYASIESL
ncbi:valine--tRNA ligase [Coxiella burnetii]|uniref:Valine--tRNA ligase n=1 Tax=Coxiella burnetii (strain RSA 493 / Nine Mile phase I) TaxID=227377 RepID=SYV_COXBU|nr:valine--tRNA ligase [Coxiella burnetii]NP_819828.1 valine--tRNA ligase [Coxiella burnetii RSA 493]Q83DD0.1 RecName: Full=Valine--tRNA ligase; AltName: Full=Valyl-tRNA synthetase; Short=ValRS [Coxiella burnetii RSA 493]AAO90342.1 valyl-tRNA synthetase [Coxiella burnetii RSA 493]ARI65643.1 valine--tRNA ligase [Coxiella burnetii]ARK27119.1 valine--tRNA ligase [Coxiella burnetii]ATN74239.1 valine--tRNA ligase [Coxiella burnetii]ATN76145.1 valine--tRNA ligase [Coxiella burnetii]